MECVTIFLFTKENTLNDPDYSVNQSKLVKQTQNNSNKVTEHINVTDGVVSGKPLLLELDL